MVRFTLFASLFIAAARAVDINKVDFTSLSTDSRLPGAYIFEFDDDNDTTDFFTEATAQGSTRMQYNYTLFRGASIQFNDIENSEDLATRMARFPGVKQMWPVKVYGIPTPKVEWRGTPGMDYDVVQKRDLNERDGKIKDVFSPHVMTQVDKLRAEGATGKGLKVALVDSGIDYTHPALGGCFGPGCLVSFGRDLVGDAYTGLNIANPDDDPMDCQGHGTHVAGIIAAQKNPMGFTGAAPGVTLGSYRTFGCHGEAGNDVLIAAFNQAYEDGADIISASIGGPAGWSEEAWAVTASRIVKKGVPCILSAGNAGDKGMFYASTAGNGKHVTSVASFDNTKTLSLLNTSHYSVGDNLKQEFGSLAGKPDNWNNVKLPLWALNFDTTAPDDGCDPFPANTPDLGKYVVLLRRGTCDFTEKAQNAAKKGAEYIMIYNNKPGALAIDLSSVEGIKAVAMVTSEQGKTWIDHLKKGEKVILHTTGTKIGDVTLEQTVNNATGGAPSIFSSWGPTWEMDVKPQFGAPGGQILSTIPVKMGSYAVLSGTSMATPLMAGIFALISEIRNTLDPILIENVLSATSNPQLFNDGTAFYDFLAPVPQQGGGLVQAHDAAHAKILLSPSSLSFNDTDNFVESLNFTIKNTCQNEVTFNISHVPAVTMYTLVKNTIYPDGFPNEFANEHASVKFSESSVSVGPGESVVIEVLPTPPTGVDVKRLPVWSGYVTLNGTDGSSLSLPYQGLTGSLHDSRVLGPKDTWMSKSSDSNFVPVNANTSFTLPKPGTATNSSTSVLPVLVWFLALGSAKLHGDIIPVAANISQNVGRNISIGEPVKFPMLWNAMGAKTLPWTGELSNGSYAAAGDYFIRYKALRIFGDEDEDSDWDISESTPFSISYEG